MTISHINFNTFTPNIAVPHIIYTIEYKFNNGTICTFDCNKINDAIALDFAFNSNIYLNIYCIKIKPNNLYFIGKFNIDMSFTNGNNDVKIFDIKNIQSIYIDDDKQIIHL